MFFGLGTTNFFPNCRDYHFCKLGKGVRLVYCYRNANKKFKKKCYGSLVSVNLANIFQYNTAYYL